MIQPGEVRCYVGGHYELFAIGDGLFTTVWVQGIMVCRTRYIAKADRRKIIEKMVETWKDVEIAIMPDDIEAMEEQVLNLEKTYKNGQTE